uniref:ABC transporter permease n=1 Tax=Agathobacter sp. TaxID=2021311 RepID=UPI0040569DFF
MTLNKVFAKLRKYNKKNYYQLKFCIAFAVMLIASFISMVLNPAIQNVLPSGGDSRKIVYMIFIIAIIGCSIFIIYATRLFLRYRSREIGVFLALGAEKKQLSKAVYGELSKIGVLYSLIGMVLGFMLAYMALKIFRILFPFGIGEPSFISIGGVLVSVLYGIAIVVCMMVLAVTFMKRTNIIDVLNEQRINESIKQNLNKKYIIIGVSCLILGVLIAGVGAQAYSRIMKQSLGIWINLFYLLSLFGLYRILIYCVAVHKKGKNPQKYYKNLISYGLLKFQGRSIVRNMLIVSLLIVCSLFACLYSPTKYISEREGINNNPVDFTMSYPLSADELEKRDIENLADKYEVEITDYHEAEFIRLLGSGVNRDDIDENGKLIEKYEKEYLYYSFINAAAFNAITGEGIEVEDGTYYMVQNSSMYENQYNKYDDLDYVQNVYAGIEKELEYAGTVEYSGLVTLTGFDGLARYVISDNDYAGMKRNLPDNMIVKSILFNVADLEKSYLFAKELYKQYCDCASVDMLKMTGYDEHQEEICLKADSYYAYADPVFPNAEHPEQYCDWKYAPFFKILDINHGFISFGVFYMLFIYVSIICLAAVAIISYTRSMTVAVKNKQVFEDVRRLGGNNEYIKRILSDQLRRIYTLPTIMSCSIMLFWYPTMMWQNDGRITPAEIKIIFVELVLCAIIVLYQYIIYRISMKQGEKAVITNEGV